MVLKIRSDIHRLSGAAARTKFLEIDKCKIN